MTTLFHTVPPLSVPAYAAATDLSTGSARYKSPDKTGLPEHQPDATLLLMVSECGDVKAYEVLFHRYYKPMCRFVFTLVHCRQMTEEIVSDVFIKIWNNRETIQILTNLKAYLVISMRNQSIDYIRRKQRKRTVSSDVINPDFPCENPNVDARLIGNEAVEIVESAVEKLPPQGKIIFRLSRDGGLKYREIADHLQISIKTVETHMTRSLIFLRKEVSAQLGLEFAI